MTRQTLRKTKMWKNILIYIFQNITLHSSTIRKVKSYKWPRQNFISNAILRKVMRMKTNINWGINSWLIQYQILQTFIIRIVWQMVRRITNEILGVKGLKVLHVWYKLSVPLVDQSFWRLLEVPEIFHKVVE